MAIRPSSLLALSMAMALAGGCSTTESAKTDSSGQPKILATGTKAEIEAEALRMAKEDIAAGRPRICISGGFAAYPVGVPADSMKEVSVLSVWRLPCGCNDPLLGPAMDFAQVYNTEIVHYLHEKNAAK